MEARNKKAEAESVHSGVYLEKRAFNWYIEHFDIIRLSEELTSSQKFFFHAGKRIALPTYWKFHLRPSSSKIKGTEEEKKTIGLYLQLEHKPKFVEKVVASFSAKIRKDDGSMFYQNDTGFKTFEKNGTSSSWGWVNALSQNALLEELPLKDGRLHVELEFTMSAPQVPATLDDAGEVSVVAVTEESSTSHFGDQLERDLEKLLKEHSGNPDTVIVSKPPIYSKE